MNYLVQAASLPGAVKSIEEVMGGTMIDYVIASIAETSFMDVFLHTDNMAKGEANDVPEYEAQSQEEKGTE